MKLRTGFVTNSSSSSFICLFGEVTNREKAIEKFGKYNIHTWYDLLENQWFEIGADWAGCFCDIELEDLDPLKEYVHWKDSYGDECDFWDEEDCYYKYDIDLSFFPKDMQDKYFAKEEDGVKVLYKGYGAGRNG